MAFHEQTPVGSTTTTPVVSTPTAPVVPTNSTPIVTTTSRTVSPRRDEMARRITVFVAGIVQGLIILRLVLLLFDARATNGLVSIILNLSQVFVAPFDGIIHTNALHAGGSMLDIAAIVALIGWTIVEGLIIASIGLFRREAA